MKPYAIAALAFLSFACSRTDSRSQTAPAIEASAIVAVVSDASAGPPADSGAPAATTIEQHCRDFIAENASPQGFSCRGESAHPTCKVTEKKSLATLGTIVRIDEKGPEGTQAMLAIVDRGRHFAILAEARTEDCDLGEPANVSLELVSANESADAGTPIATIVFDSLRDDPPYQSGPRILSATRRSVRCQAGSPSPTCDEPATLGSFSGPNIHDKPPPFSQWNRKN